MSSDDAVVSNADALAPPESPAAAPAPWLATLRQPLSTLQTVVGIIAGVLTIGGGFLSFSGFATPTALAQQGEIVAVVHDLRTSKPVANARVEIFTAQDAIVTAVKLEPDGRLARRLKDGRYRVRVTHPSFVPEVRQIEIHAGQRSDIEIALAPRASAPRVTRAVVVEEPQGPIQKFFRNLFE